MAQRIKVGSTDQVPEGDGRTVEVDGKKIALFRANGFFYAVDAECPHRGGPLAEGALDDGAPVVTCPWHGWRFDLKTGRTPMRSDVRIGCYEVRVEDDEVYLSLPDAAEPSRAEQG